MPVGKSNRIVIDIDLDLKRRLHAQLTRDGVTLKDWFQEQAEEYLEQQSKRNRQQMNLPLGGDYE